MSGSVNAKTRSREGWVWINCELVSHVGHDVFGAYKEDLHIFALSFQQEPSDLQNGKKNFQKSQTTYHIAWGLLANDHDKCVLANTRIFMSELEGLDSREREMISRLKFNDC